MFYVIARNANLSLDIDTPYRTFDEAKEKAVANRAEFGGHYYVIKVETVWFTSTLADLQKEGRF